MNVETREARSPEDLEFLRLVYACTRHEDLRLLGWSATDPAAQDFLRIQFEAQSCDYSRRWPAAVSEIVLADGRPAGRLITDRSPERIHVLDLSLVPTSRGMGVGGTVVRRLLRDADSSSLTTTCEVVVDNGARGFWEHFGFRTRSAGSVYMTMERACETSPS